MGFRHHWTDLHLVSGARLADHEGGHLVDYVLDERVGDGLNVGVVLPTEAHLSFTEVGRFGWLIGRATNNK